MHIWNGDVDSNWDWQPNWEASAIPGLNPDMYIPKDPTNFLTLDFPTTVGTIIIESGASFISNNNFLTANLMYRREIPTTNWYLTAAPVTGLDIDDFVNNAKLATGTGSNVALGSYDNSIPGWTYYQDGTSTSDTFTPGVGYAVKRTAVGTIDYIGGMSLDDVTVTITRNANGFNLLGNPYPSYLEGNTGSANLLTANTDILEETTLWLWNQATNSYDQKNLASSSFKVAPGQAFFVETKTGGGTFDITEAMQSHESTDTFQRGISTDRPEVKITASKESDIRSVDIYYINGTTTNFDNGYDSSIFGGLASDFLMYTGLVNGDNNKKLGIQSLPDSGFEDMVIPIGLKSDAGEIDFEINAVNLPSNINLYLEDREANTFTKVEDTSIKVTLDAPIEGIGRFYLHTTSEALSTDSIDELTGIQIFSSSDYTLNISGISEEYMMKVFSVTGQEVVSKKLTNTPTQSVILPRVTKGIYLVQLSTSNKIINKKVVLH